MKSQQISYLTDGRFPERLKKARALAEWCECELQVLGAASQIVRPSEGRLIVLVDVENSLPDPAPLADGRQLFIGVFCVHFESSAKLLNDLNDRVSFFWQDSVDFAALREAFSDLLM